MHDTSAEFMKLHELLVEGAKKPDLVWEICIQYGLFLHLMNEQIRNAKSSQEEINIIEEFVKLNKSQVNIAQEFVDFIEGQKLNIFSSKLESPYKELVSNLMKEKELFLNNLNRIKRLKKAPKKRPTDRSKWLRS